MGDESISKEKTGHKLSDYEYKSWIVWCCLFPMDGNAVRVIKSM
jgi:hypothetical protein